MTDKSIWIITGTQYSGKTVTIQAIIDCLKTNSLPICGVISPGAYKDNKRIKIMAENIESNDRYVLAHYSPGWDLDMPQKKWKMDEKGLQWGNEQLGKINVKNKVFIIDELGFYELLHHQGWIKAIQIIKTKEYGAAVLAVRKEMIGEMVNICEKAKIKPHIYNLDEKQVPVKEICSEIVGLSTAW